MFFDSRRGRLLVLAALVLAVPALSAPKAPSRPQTKTPPPAAAHPTGIISPMYLEQSWAALCFEVGLSVTQIGKLRPTYQWGWTTRAAAMKTATAKGDFSTALSTLGYIKQVIDPRLKTVLTPTQLAKYHKWESDLEAQRQRWRSRAGSR